MNRKPEVKCGLHTRLCTSAELIMASLGGGNSALIYSFVFRIAEMGLQMRHERRSSLYETYTDRKWLTKAMAANLGLRLRRLPVIGCPRGNVAVGAGGESGGMWMSWRGTASHMRTRPIVLPRSSQ